MSKIFENITKLSDKSYDTFLQFHCQKYNGIYHFYTALFSLLLLFCSLANFFYGNLALGFFILLSLFAFLGWRFYQPYYKVKKEKNSEKLTKPLINTFSFYDKYFKIRNRHGLFKVRYFELFKAFETKDFFYLYIEKEHALLVEKATFTIGNAKDFSTFIKKKTRFNYRKEIK